MEFLVFFLDFFNIFCVSARKAVILCCKFAKYHETFLHPTDAGAALLILQ